MPATETLYEHIRIDKNQTPYISNTNTKVVEIVLGKIAYGWSPEELHFQYPHLTLGQIYAALAYYSDHDEEFDRVISEQLKNLNTLKNNTRSETLIQN